MSIRLVDYEGLHHEKVAEQMNVSRPTLTRIYEKARKIVALCCGRKMINIEGGSCSLTENGFAQTLL